MTLNFVFWANAIAFIGILACFYAYVDMGVKDNPKLGYKLYIAGTILLMASAIMLKSIPSFWLNAVWCIISLFGLFDKPLTLPSRYSRIVYFCVPLTCIIGAVAVAVDFKHLGAFMTSTLYLLTYFLFSANAMSKRDYYAWCILGIFFVSPLLLSLSQYSVFGYEVLGVIMSLVVVYKEMRQNSAPTATIE